MSDESTTISSMEDFKRQYGDGPAFPPFDPVERARLLGLENIPSRWRWLAGHPRLLSIAYFLRPSWQPPLWVYRVIAEDCMELQEQASQISADIFATFERRLDEPDDSGERLTLAERLEAMAEREGE